MRSNATVPASVLVCIGLWVPLKLQAAVGVPEDKVVDVSFHLQPSSATLVEGVNRSGRVIIQAGEMYTQRFLLNRLASLTAPGKYKVRAILMAPIRMESGITAPVSNASQDLVLEVGDRDPQHLTNVCKELEREAMSVDETAMQSALALGYVTDLIAVPFLEELMHRGPFLPVTRSKAMEGLARIARAEGPDPVISRPRNPDPELRAYLTAEARAARP